MGAMGQYLGISAAAGVAVRSLFEPSAPARVQCKARPIVLLHGFAAHSRVLLPLERYLRKSLKRPVVRIALGPGFGSIRELAQHVHDQLDSILPETYLDSADNSADNYVDIVGHSMGGLVASYLLKRIDRGRRIRRVVTLGTPHQGTLTAVLGVLSTFCAEHPCLSFLRACTHPGCVLLGSANYPE